MSQRGNGGIIFVSSVGAYVGGPYNANYIASKAFLLNLGTALHVELKPKGVDVLVLSPGPTRTEMVDAVGVDFSKVPMNWMKAGTVAAAGLRALGHKSMLVPGGINKKMVTMMTRFMPRQMALSMFGSMMSKTMDPSLL
ncbi:MAG: SDR family NAD(P)-dependent oxidoreductase [Chloroflexi bacterium]|nr:SDR family NAD(P)-dependent oxidoreductase [Chloroflexota bacterium]